LLPTRILLLKEKKGKISLKLHVAPGERGIYAALSHRWGGDDIIKLTQGRLRKFQRGIKFQKLPETFQDAARVALGLGIQYLWIDSLCIIQDSETDWLMEAGRMGDVYAQSHVTIAADSAKNAHSGLFGTSGDFARLWQAFQRRFEVPSLCGGSTWVMARLTHKLDDKRGEVAHRIVHGQAMHSFAPGFLDQRGWTFQERLLSPRVLHCAHGEFAWECFRHLRCECQTVPSPKQDRVRYRATLRNHLSTSGNTAPLVPTFAWSKVVEEFTRRALTKQSDRLYAVSGVAALMGPGAAASYLCGLWREDLPLYLMWYRVAPGRLSSAGAESQRQTDFFSPTWSWASISGEVECHRQVNKAERAKSGRDDSRSGGEDEEAHQEAYPGVGILQVQYKASKGNPFGPPLEAALVVDGAMSDGTIVRYQDMNAAQVERIRNRHGAIWMSPGLDVQVGPTGTFLFPDDLETRPPIVIPDVWGTANEIRTGDRVSALWLWGDMALVLKRTEFGVDVLRRVGSISPKYGGTPKMWSRGVTRRRIWLI
jgi:hypothetical protein